MFHKLLIILQTHSRENPSSGGNRLNYKSEKRYCGAPKIEVSKRCVTSLLNTIEFASKQTPKTNYKLIIVDDHSDQEFIDFLEKKITFSKFPIELIKLETYGIMPSILKCYELGKEKGEDLVYFAQDDYLYEESAIFEMIDSYDRFKKISNMEVCIYPYDDPFRYTLSRYNYKVVLGSKRHWRNAYHTASCFMMSHQTIVENWDLFEKMGKSEYNSICEDISINRLFLQMEGMPERKINHLLFTPIPSLALHMGFESEKDPYIDWRILWDRFKDDEKNECLTLPTEKRILLNLGCGKTSIKNAIFNDGLLDHHEIRIDIDVNSNPDIISDITNLSMIPNNSVDAIYTSHCLEHVDFHKIIDCVKEWYRVLKIGGEIRIIVPNILTAAKAIAQGNPFTVMYQSQAGPIDALDIFYGHKGLTAQNPYMAHKTGFTPDSMKSLLDYLGFKHQVMYEDFNIIAKVEK